MRGWLVLGLWLLTFTVAYFGLGGFLGTLIEGVDRSLVSAAPLLTTLMLVVSITASVIWARRTAVGRVAPEGVGRRRFLVGAGVRAGAGFRRLTWSIGEGLLAYCVQHVDDLGKTEKQDTAQKA